MPMPLVPFLAIFFGVVMGALGTSRARMWMFGFFVASVFPNALFFAQFYRDWSYLYVSPSVPRYVDLAILGVSLPLFAFGLMMASRRNWLTAGALVSAITLVALLPQLSQRWTTVGTYASFQDGFSTVAFEGTHLARALLAFDLLSLLGLALALLTMSSKAWRPFTKRV